jgi:hypothetical protein
MKRQLRDANEYRITPPFLECGGSTPLLPSNPNKPTQQEARSSVVAGLQTRSFHSFAFDFIFLVTRFFDSAGRGESLDSHAEVIHNAFGQNANRNLRTPRLVREIPIMGLDVSTNILYDQWRREPRLITEFVPSLLRAVVLTTGNYKDTNLPQ